LTLSRSTCLIKSQDMPIFLSVVVTFAQGCGPSPIIKRLTCSCSSAWGFGMSWNNILFQVIMAFWNLKQPSGPKLIQLTLPKPWKMSTTKKNNCLGPRWWPWFCKLHLAPLPEVLAWASSELYFCSEAFMSSVKSSSNLLSTTSCPQEEGQWPEAVAKH